MIGLPTNTSSSTSVGSAFASAHSSPRSACMAVRTAAVISASPPGFIIE